MIERTSAQYRPQHLAIGNVGQRAAHVRDRENEPQDSTEQRHNGGCQKHALPLAEQHDRFGVRIRVQRKKRHTGERGHCRVVQKPRDDKSKIDHQRATLNE